MRTSNIFAFENEAAGEWLARFLEDPDVIDLRQTLISTSEAEDLEIEEGSEAVAAAEVVSALLGQPADDLPPGVGAWVADQDVTVTHDLKVLSVRAVERVLGQKSALRERWEKNPEGFAIWKRALEGLIERLL